ncbi:hypothetical protein B0G71_0940 [Paraburkholderia sp. BL27I4N3]|uniref:hypothetical protein n=1 Tax=Paraburkholderia sp. BL27I4N3 TaxID=1938805 RepID=UPI000E24A287|nr:hypothetical protein [Paraburkholderia sp. BL27I4N3]REE17963.1 hypothetical protein B0G71_0940 [Paraburkholderia sp. BL27I4N3]
MANTKKTSQSKRAEMIALIGQYPGITSADIAQRLGLESSNKVGPALWTAIKGGRILTERVERNGRWMNKHYLPDQVPPDAVTRVHQRIVDASEVIPPPGALSAPTSVFNGPRKSPKRKWPVHHRAASGSKVIDVQTPAPKSASRFACAITSSGNLVLMRAGEIQFSLSDAEAATLQSYLVKRAAANLFASMA